MRVPKQCGVRSIVSEGTELFAVQVNLGQSAGMRFRLD